MKNTTLGRHEWIGFLLAFVLIALVLIAGVIVWMPKSNDDKTRGLNIRELLEMQPPSILGKRVNSNLSLLGGQEYKVGHNLSQNISFFKFTKKDFISSGGSLMIYSDCDGIKSIGLWMNLTYNMTGQERKGFIWGLMLFARIYTDERYYSKDNFTIKIYDKDCQQINRTYTFDSVPYGNDCLDENHCFIKWEGLNENTTNN